MNKANLLKAKHAQREDPKSVALRNIPALQKGFRPELKRSVYFIELLYEETETTEMYQLLWFDSLQQVIDEYAIVLPQLRPYASVSVIAEMKTLLEETHLEETEITNQYWECGGCSENFIHPVTEDHCAICEDTLEGAVMAKVKDVVAQGLPIDFQKHEEWKNSRQEAASE